MTVEALREDIRVREEKVAELEAWKRSLEEELGILKPILERHLQREMLAEYGHLVQESAAPVVVAKSP